ncbi:MAG: lysophospholipid acyltransferase family protein [Thermoanaerobaculia bacterium]
MTRSKTVKSSPALAGLIHAVVKFGGLLPLAPARACGSLLGRLCAALPLEPRKVADLNLKLSFPEMPAAERRRLARRSLEEAGKSLMEVACLWQWPLQRIESLPETVEGEELLQRSLANGRGTVLLAPHFGNWEFLNHFLARRFPLVYLYRPPRIAELDELVCRARGRTGATAVPASPAGLRPLLRTLRSELPILILPDQEPLKEHGVHAPFFGVPALTMTLVSRLLRRTGADALYVFAERRPGGFHVRFREALPGLDDSDPVVAATALNRGVEDCVRLCREQYLWSYKRFLTAPPGEPTPYREIWSRRRLRRNPWPPLTPRG